MWSDGSGARDEEVPGYCGGGSVFAHAAQDDVCAMNKLCHCDIAPRFFTPQSSNSPNDTKRESTGCLALAQKTWQLWAIYCREASTQKPETNHTFLDLYLPSLGGDATLVVNISQEGAFLYLL